MGKHLKNGHNGEQSICRKKNQNKVYLIVIIMIRNAFINQNYLSTKLSVKKKKYIKPEIGITYNNN